MGAVSNFPHGFGHGVTIRGVPLQQSHSGKVFWVGNSTAKMDNQKTGSNGNDGTFLAPYATVDYAVGRCTASRGDIIFVLPGHAETLTAAGALALDVAGIAVIGLGVGNNRPRLTLTPAAVGTAVVTHSAANVAVKNIIFIGGTDAATTPYSITGAQADIDVEWQDTSSAVEAETAFLGGTGADKLLLKVKFVGFAGDAGVAIVKLNGTDGANITLDAFGKWSTAAVNFITTACTNVEVYGYVYNSADTTGAKLVVDTISGSTWYAKIEAGAAGNVYSGGSAAAMASDDVSVANATLGAVATAAATGAVTSTDNLMAYIKQLVTQHGIELDTDTLGAILMGSNGIATFPTAAAAANGVSLAKVLRYVSEYQVPRVVSKTIAAWGTSFTTGLSPVSLFTVTGNVKCRVFMVQTTAATSTGTTGTIAIGVSGNTGGLLAAVTANGTNFPTNSVWAGDTSPTLLGEALSGTCDTWFLVGNGADIIATIATNDMTAGASTFYCEYIPLDSSSSVVAA